jgi:hypothetical protein
MLAGVRIMSASGPTPVVTASGKGSSFKSVGRNEKLTPHCLKQNVTDSVDTPIGMAIASPAQLTDASTLASAKSPQHQSLDCICKLG